MLGTGLIVNSIRMTGVIKNARLARQEEQRLKKAEEELRLTNEELKRLSVYLKNVREEERKYIAREVHDELGQLASALKIDIDWLAIKNPGMDDIGKMRIAHANNTIEVLIASIRKIASTLRPSVLDDFGLNTAIEWQCREFQNLNSIQCTFKADFDDDNLPMEMKTELFRMTQESLTNVMRHSNAGSVTVKLTEDEENIYLRIADDGRGFDTKVKKNTLGLIGLRERAVSINGELRIESELGKGTNVLAVIPKNKIYENSNR
jgi:signal transduction histidine kinase